MRCNVTLWSCYTTSFLITFQVMSIVSPMTLLHSSGKQLKRGAKSPFLPWTSLALASHDPNSVVNGTNAFLRSRQMKGGAT